MEPSGLSAVRRGHPQRPRYETPVWTDTCTEWSPLGCQPSGEGTHRDSGTDRQLYRMEPSGLSAVRRGHPQRPRYGQTLVQNGALWAVSRQARVPTETSVRTDSCTEWSPRAPTVTCYGQTLVHLYRMEPSGLSGEGHRDPGTDRHLYRMQLSAVRRGHPQRPITDRHLYRMEPSGLSAVRRGHPQRPRYGQTLVNYGALQAVSRQARAPTETAVRTDTCTEWSPPGCEPSDEGTHRDPSTDRHLYRMEPSGLSAVRRGHPQRTPVRAVRRGHPQRPWYGQTLVQNGPLRAVRRGLQRPRYGQALVQNGALWGVSRQARVPTESPVRTDTWTEWSPLGCSRQAWAPTETLVRTDTCTEWSRPGCRPSGEGTHRDPSTDRHLYRMEPSGLSAVGRVLQRPRYGQTLVQNGPLRAVRRGLQRPRYGQTLVQNGALRAVSRQARAPTETPVMTETCTEWSPLGCQARAHTETPVRTDTCTEWSPLGCQPSGEGTHRDPSTDRHLYRMELSAIRTGHPQRPLYGLSALRRGHPQRPQYGQTLVQNGALRTVSHQARAPTETPVRTDTSTEWSPPGCQPSGEGTHRDPGMRPRYGQTLVQNGALWAVSRQARAPTETPVRTDTCTEWNPPSCQPSGEGTHRDPGTDRHLYRMEPSGLSAIRRGYPQRPLYGQTVVQNGALRAVSPQPRAPTVTCYGQTLVHLYRMEPSGLSGEGHRDPSMDRHLYRMQLSAVRRGHPQRPITDRHLYRMEPSGLSAVRRGHP
ncbi:hypothetical protein NDU88_006660 [Pleurodeles waltl]|uniref:Uncharacterized protein n=1 Tax=Pleurodeles waltl TaxID=8319 RepID=A0AAV7L6F7_PLEWA|nr:hypothetical protein NDU88_006660 [Pleurodeles waltl]